MNLLGDERYRLEISRQVPLRREADAPAEAMFDHHLVALVRDDDRVCGVAHAFFPLPNESTRSLVAAAVAVGSEFLARACAELITAQGFVRDEVSEALDDATSQAFIVDHFAIVDPIADKPILRGMFARALMDALARPMDALLINAPASELPFWSATLGAKLVRGFIIASGARRLPEYPPRPARRRSRRTETRLRLLDGSQS